MVHIFKPKQTLGKLDIVAGINGWERLASNNERSYSRGSQRVDVVKVDGGYKVVLSKNNVMWDGDIMKDKGFALMMAGEALQYRVW